MYIYINMCICRYTYAYIHMENFRPWDKKVSPEINKLSVKVYDRFLLNYNFYVKTFLKLYFDSSRIEVRTISTLLRALKHEEKSFSLLCGKWSSTRKKDQCELWLITLVINKDQSLFYFILFLISRRILIQYSVSRQFQEACTLPCTFTMGHKIVPHKTSNQKNIKLLKSKRNSSY